MENDTKKAQGGKRVMYTSHHPCWDAKNRHGLAPELPFDFKQVADLFAPLSGLPFRNDCAICAFHISSLVFIVSSL